ncbi:MAG: phosphodiester glycosidase family protein [Deltaproteobacteria bacterium]|nr:phosphodiester glycosidase family protein [Deltaproteobacteria bacterium]MBI4373315.1 phosphodiester glycosidase family protein [Deltaproteobacteria bacterium]
MALPSAAHAWRTLQKGLDYRQEGARVHLFKIDPKEYRFDLLTAADSGMQMSASKTYREKSGALLVINGGFFDENIRPLGLLVKKGKMRNPLRNSEWGIFQIIDRTPSIIHRREWNPEKVEMAIQVGPRLVIDNKIPSFKPEEQPHRRSAIGITKGKKILIAIADEPIEMKRWAELVQRQAPDTMNLDGGGSSQISVRLKDFSLELIGTTGVPNAVAVFEK